MILATSKPAGAPSTEAVRICPALNPSIPAYTAITPVAIVDMPVVISAMTSLCVILGRYGLITRAASVCPRKILLAPARLSLPLVRIVFIITQAMAATTFCRTPQ